MPRRTVLRSGAQAEEAFQSQVLRLARLRGWLTFHPYDSRRSRAGFPDVCCVRPPRVLFLELKSADGTVSAHQRLWLATLRACPGCETYLWAPADWSAIEQTLA